ncbi:Cyclic nucleotide phosphodiesterase [Klebsormidium nitens]|uniref:Phosphodiesterase n=1 Tax=Klebsormidium nitens TaxID=105231 RepID=A0A1Y1I6A5_KLENI|nr:Cyclic nucleotide phosphodiesterase [Klebsormidium nitens]|eukprot:GAQ86043.1 Cyclic nucleotide phosphodiesterase [Klebsormidium nitens]
MVPGSASIMMMQRELFKKRLTKKTSAKGIQQWEVCALPEEKHPSRRRRNTAQQLVSIGELKVVDESFRWLAQAYHLDQYSNVNGAFASKPLPATSDFHQPEQSQAPSLLIKSGSSPWLNRLAQPERKQIDKEGRETLQRTGSTGELSVEKVQAEDENVSEMLKGIHRRDFDVFEFATADGGVVLKPVASAIFKELGLLEKINIGKQTMDAFLASIEAGYCEVPYHNACHATDVLLAVYSLISSSSMAWMTDHEVFSLLIAAIIHDFKHPGVSNGYLIASRDPLATRYNDRAVLNIMKGFSSEHQKAIRALIIQLVLITDMSEHFNFVNKFKAFVLGPDFSLEDQQHRLYVFQMILKCADLNSAAKPLRLAKVWADRVTDEFFNQGDLEKKLGLPVSPMCDKQAADIPRQQLRFIDFIVQPMFESFAEYCPALDEWFRDLENNKEYWESQCKGAQQCSGRAMRRSNSERSLKL